MINMRSIGEAIRIARVRKGITQDVMSSDLGMSPSTLSRLERGKLDSDLGAIKLIRCMEYVDLDMSIVPRKVGYTLEDAQADNAEEMGLPAPPSF